jgi:hypothetical protein
MDIPENTIQYNTIQYKSFVEENPFASLRIMDYFPPKYIKAKNIYCMPSNSHLSPSKINFSDLVTCSHPSGT